MKQLKQLSFLFMITLFAISCSFHLVDNVQIEGSPEYNLPLGSRILRLSDVLDVDEMLLAPLQENFGEDATGSVEEGAYTISIAQELFKVSTDDFFTETLDFGDLDQTIEPLTFSVPQLDLDPISVEQNIEPIDLPASVTLPLVDYGPIVEPVHDVAMDPITVPIEADGYDIVTFSQGKLAVNLQINEPSDSVEITITEIQVVDGGGNHIVNADQTELVITKAQPAGNITFPLTAVELPVNFGVSMVLEFVDPDIQAEEFYINLDPAFTDNPKISAAEGVTFDKVTGSVNEVLPFEAPANFISAIIETGGINIDLNLPNAWSGIKIDLDLTLLQAGVDFELTESTTDPGFYDLAGKEIKDGDFIVGLTYTISGTNASFELTAKPEVTGNVTMDISEFSKLVLTADDLDFSVTHGFIIDDELLDIIQEVKLSKSDLVFNFLNGLPSDLSVDFSSTVLLGNESTQTRTFTGDPEATETQREVIDLVNAIDFTALPTVIDAEGNEGRGIDMVLSFTLDGYDETTKQLTLTNVAPGTAYSFAGSVNLDIEVAEITLAEGTFDGAIPESDTEEPLDFSMLDEFLPPGVNLKGVVAEMVFAGVEDFTGDIVLLAKYSDSADDIVVTPLVGDLKEGADSSSFNPENYKGENFSPADTISMDLETVINHRPDDLELKYAITINGLVIDLTDESAEDLKILLDLKMPLRLDVTPLDDSEYEDRVLWKLPGFAEDGNISPFEGDLLQRVDAEGNEDQNQIDFIDKVLAQVREAVLELEIINDMGFEPLLVFRAGEKNNGDWEIEEDVYFRAGEEGEAQTIAFEESVIEYMRESTTFSPELLLYLPAGEHAFNPEADFTLSARFKLGLDLAFDIPLGSDE